MQRFLSATATLMLVSLLSACSNQPKKVTFPDLTESNPPRSSTLLVVEGSIATGEPDYEFHPRAYVFEDEDGNHRIVDRLASEEDEGLVRRFVSVDLRPGSYQLIEVRGRRGRSVGCAFPFHRGPYITLGLGKPVYLGTVAMDAAICIDCEPPCWQEGTPSPEWSVEEPQVSERRAWEELLATGETPWASQLKERLAELP